MKLNDFVHNGGPQTYILTIEANSLIICYAHQFYVSLKSL